MARPERFELPTTWFEARYSIHLSYGRFVFIVWLLDCKYSPQRAIQFIGVFLFGRWGGLMR